ncbi:MAG: DUF2959 domain-containing protein [Kiritimatiellae bacterium]|nr:DUF2959 domain-containing protein [Kiritimatiellia bacterium]
MAAMLAVTAGCSSMYYGAMEKMGVHKRDIMVDRVKAARDTQQQTKEQFVSAMETFKSVVAFEGGELEEKYNRLNAALERSEDGATAVRNRIRAVEDVSQALFKEWKAEIRQYTNETFRRSSQEKLDLTRKKYNSLIVAMKKAEARLEPALTPLRDQVLFLKHNLNAQAIAGLSSELAGVQGTVDRLVKEMEASIAEADEFISSMKEG